jgi:tetratricopeptide (TPR) repeat protein
LDIIYNLSLRNDDRDLSVIAARLALDNGQMERAIDAYRKLECLDRGHPIMTEIMLRMGNKNDALKNAVNDPDKSVDAGIIFGMCLFENGQVSEAKECLERTRLSMLDDGCLYRMDELLRYEAMAEKEMNRPDRASMLIDAALSLNRNERIRLDLISLKDSILSVSEDGVLLECVDV